MEEELPPVGLLWFCRKTNEKDIPKIMSEEEYLKLQSYDFMLNRASYEEYKNFKNKEINEMKLYVKNDGQMLGKTTFNKRDINHTKKSVDDVESNDDFTGWVQSSALIIEKITGYKPNKIVDINGIFNA